MGLKRGVCVFVILLLTIVSFVNVFSFRVLGKGEMGVHNLDSGLSYASIQEAIVANDTLNGHTISVDAGFYRENVVVDKNVSLVAEEGFDVVVDGGGNGTVFSVVADSVNITGFVIQNSGMESDFFGVFLNRSSGCVIGNNIVMNSYYGARLYYAHDNILLNNTFSNCNYGVWLAYSERNVVLDNRAFDNERVGFHLYPSSHNVLSRNEAWNNEHGIYIYFSENNTLLENRVFNNTYGIWFSGCVNNSVCGNEAYNNTYGVRLTASGTNMFLENVFDGNDFGISLSDSSDNFVFHNNFLNNTGQSSTVDSANLFDNGVEGNYWSDYEGFDEDNDGIGDTPYVIDENNTDRYPLMGRFFGFSVILEEEEYGVYVISNCSVSVFEFSVEFQMLRFGVSGLNGTVCFCRVMFPRPVLAGPYMVVVDGAEVDAVLLPVSDISHVFLYFVFNMSSREVVVGSKPFYTLLERYDELMVAYNDLIANYTKLWDAYCSLNSSYYDLLGNYTDLQSSLDSLQTAYDLLNSTYNGLVANYTGLWDDYCSLNTSHYYLMDDYTKLQTDLDSLQAMYDMLNSTYYDLAGTYETVKAELGDVRLLMYGFLAATVVGVVVSVVSLGFGFRYYRRFREQRRIIEAYGLDPLDVARALFELDVRKRGEKIERFEEKYGVKIRPRASLEDIIESLKSRKERRKRG